MTPLTTSVLQIVITIVIVKEILIVIAAQVPRRLHHSWIDTMGLIMNKRQHQDIKL